MPWEIVWLNRKHIYSPPRDSFYVGRIFEYIQPSRIIHKLIIYIKLLLFNVFWKFITFCLLWSNNFSCFIRFFYCYEYNITILCYNKIRWWEIRRIFVLPFSISRSLRTKVFTENCKKSITYSVINEYIVWKILGLLRTILL